MEMPQAAYLTEQIPNSFSAVVFENIWICILLPIFQWLISVRLAESRQLAEEHAKNVTFVNISGKEQNWRITIMNKPLFQNISE